MLVAARSTRGNTKSCAIRRPNICIIVNKMMYCVSDLKSGRYIDQPNKRCDKLCVGKKCCDPLATCSCGTHTGQYECICPAGYYGNGLKGGCQGRLLSDCILFLFFKSHVHLLNRFYMSTVIQFK